ncbi:MAG TPA: hypothetical protein QF589_03365 [Anaerolineales bacterium]|jgi:hypothetical protein|nr:hypothetical protein [Dehalococcoidia bacterium]MDP7345987.1 hypothetical protein [Anaerolineales bacterium]HJN41129.1 hypothetical protein [Anaerolineales bacterium]|tara:strand:- start:3634 stop:3840 length:207 start_codon:yes stop_codon:yes gene_type:complete
MTLVKRQPSSLMMHAIEIGEVALGDNSCVAGGGVHLSKAQVQKAFNATAAPIQEPQVFADWRPMRLSW